MLVTPRREREIERENFFYYRMSLRYIIINHFKKLIMKKLLTFLIIFSNLYKVLLKIND